MKRSQKGIETVEFAIVAPVAFMVLLGCIEIGRALFVWNAVDEVTRYGARVAAVTDPATPDVVRTAMVSHAAGLNFTTPASQISITYYKKDGTTATTVLAEAGDGGFVTVSVAGLPYQSFIPRFFNPPTTIPAFSTTLPAESVGYVPS